MLQVDELSIRFQTSRGEIEPVSSLSLSLAQGGRLGIIGESGSGKSLTALAIMGLLPTSAAVSGSIGFMGTDLLELSEEDRRRRRGRDIAYVFQDPMSALNPVLPVGYQVAEALVKRSGLTKAAATREAIELMERVRIPSAASRVNDYPHQFSGGMRQRIVIAMALSQRPSLLIADEPTTALDVTVEAALIDLLLELNEAEGIGLVLISHDVSVIAATAETVAVMYAGQIVEEGRLHDVWDRPAHPYTRALLAAVPSPGRTGPLVTIPGRPPDPAAFPGGCRFSPRCELSEAMCERELPELQPVAFGRRSRCHFAEDVLEAASEASGVGQGP